MGKWSGENDTGSRDFTPAEANTVVQYLRQHVGKANATTTARVAADLRMNGRTLRSICSAIDGIHVVIGYDGLNKIFVAETPEDAEIFSRRLESQARNMLDRVERRRALIGAPIAQPALL